MESVVADQDLLGSIFQRLDQTTLLSTVPLVCKRWRAASLACPALWTTCDFELFLNDAGISRLRGFRHWVAPRAAHLRSLRFCCMGTGLAEEQEELQSQAWELLQEVLGELAVGLQRLDLQWSGRLGSMEWVAALGALRSLELDAPAVVLSSHLTALSRLAKLAVYTVDGAVVFEGEQQPDTQGAAQVQQQQQQQQHPEQQQGGGPAGGAEAEPMLVELAAAAQQELGDAAAAPLQQRPQPQPCPLPSGLECLSLMHAAPLRLPRRLGEITSLSRLYLSECVLSDEDEDFPAVLLQATALQHLAMHQCHLPRLPAELSRLTGLRALLLDSNIHPPAEDILAEMLEPLSSLQILGLSNCKLRALPEAVSALTHLRCLYIEQNRLADLPEGPYLGGIQILSLDWRTLLGGRGLRLLGSARSLLHLYICKAFPYLPAFADTSRQAALGEVNSALAAHPTLRRVVFVLYESERLNQQVEVASMMLELARACPRLRFQVIRYDNFFAANLDTLDQDVLGEQDQPLPYPPPVLLPGMLM